MTKYIIVTNNNYDSCADINIEEIMKSFLLDTTKVCINISNHSCISAVRALCLEGLFNPLDINVIFNDIEYRLNEYANIVKWPDDLCEVDIELAERILLKVINLRKQKRNNNGRN